MTDDTNSFKLAKLVIEAFGKSKRDQGDSKGKVVVQFNPESLSMRYQNAYQSNQTKGTSPPVARFSHKRNRTLSAKLVFDGTGVGLLSFETSPAPPDVVVKQVEELLTLCFDLQGDIHQPSFLRLTWGSAFGKHFDCRLQSVDTTYSAFDRNGAPLHAELNVQFLEDVDSERQQQSDRNSSPDVTHLRIARAGDTLPKLCLDVYGSNLHYMRVAEFNGLDDVRSLEPGKTLTFPPLNPRGGS